jgi:AraC-like DNA-binding protein
MEIKSLAYFVAMVLCAFAVLTLRGQIRLPKITANLLLVYLAMTGASFGLESLMQAPNTTNMPLWLWARMLIAFLIAPCLYLLCINLIDIKLAAKSRLPRWHGPLSFVGLISTTPLVQPILNTYLPSVISDTTPQQSLVIHLGLFISVGAFCLLCALYLNRIRLSFNARVESASHLTASATKRNRDHAILKTLITAMVLNWASVILKLIDCALLKSSGLSISLAEVGIMAWLLVLVLRHQLLRDVGHVSKYAKSGLRTSDQIRIAKRLEKLMQQQALFRDNRLNLASLSSHTGYRASYISQVLNQHLNTSFNDWLNQYRVQYVVNALQSRHDVSIQLIADEAGFNTKSTFYSAFKKITGKTPSQFRSAAKAAL